MTPFETAMAFVNAINSRDVEQLTDLMTDEDKFIDGDGSESGGREQMKAGWTEHFALIPDLTLSVSEQSDHRLSLEL